MTTKQQERDALAKIEKILKSIDAAPGFFNLGSHQLTGLFYLCKLQHIRKQI